MIETEVAMKSWTMFLISIGFLLIAVSPQLPQSLAYLLMGCICVFIGARKLKQSKKRENGKNKNRKQ